MSVSIAVHKPTGYCHYYYTAGNAPYANRSEAMNHRRGWSSLVVTQPSTGQLLWCVRCVSVCNALSGIYYRQDLDEIFFGREVISSSQTLTSAANERFLFNCVLFRA